MRDVRRRVCRLAVGVIAVSLVGGLMIGAAAAPSQITNGACKAWADVWSTHTAGSYYSYYGRLTDSNSGVVDPDCTTGSLEVEMTRNGTFIDFALRSMRAGLDQATANTTQLPANRPTKTRNYNCYSTPCQWVDKNFG